ncbi:MAG: HAD family hydrolase [Actinomycetota bacterium]
MRKTAVFLDRDGVIIEDIADSSYREIKILPKVVDSLRLLKKYDLALIVVTNQPGIAKGAFTSKDVEMVHQILNKKLKANGCPIDAFYYCPHHPTSGLSSQYTRVCQCRKPEIGLLVKAAKSFNLELDKCFMIGDFTWDIQAGKRAGCTTLLVKSRRRSDREVEAIIKESKPDFFCEDLYQAAKVVISSL